MSSTRIFKSGNSLAVRLPREIAFDEGAEVVVRRQGGSLVVTPARLDMAELVARLKAAAASLRSRAPNSSRPSGCSTPASAMARYLLDTNIVIAAALGLPGVLDRLAALEIGDVALSSISLAETLGAAAAENNGRLAENIALLAENLDVLPFDRGAADAYGALLRKLDPKRRRTLDRMIAAQALDLGLTLIAANTEDFDDIPGLTDREMGVSAAIRYSTSSTLSGPPYIRWAREACMKSSSSPSRTSEGVPEVKPERRSFTS